MKILIPMLVFCIFVYIYYTVLVEDKQYGRTSRRPSLTKLNLTFPQIPPDSLLPKLKNS